MTLLAIIYAWGYHHADHRTPLFLRAAAALCRGHVGHDAGRRHVSFYIFWELMLVASCALILRLGRRRRTATTRGGAQVLYLYPPGIAAGAGRRCSSLYNATGTDSFSALRAGVSLPPAMVTTVTALFLIGFCVKMAIFPAAPLAARRAHRRADVGDDHAGRGDVEHGHLWHPALSVEPFQPGADGDRFARADDDRRRRLRDLWRADGPGRAGHQAHHCLFQRQPDGLHSLWPGHADLRAASTGATLHVIYHAIVKALLFMCVGLVIHATGKRRIDELGGLGKACR